MNAHDLYRCLEADFVKPGITENWFRYMEELSPYLSAQFMERSIGLVCDFAQEINKVYTAVFPSERVLGSIINGGAQDAMIFLHHPSIWDLHIAPKGFYQMNPLLLDALRQRRVSLYNLHHPLDHYGEYSTSKTLADALGVKIERPFAETSGAICGVIGTTDYATVKELHQQFSQVIGHETKLYPYGEERIAGRKIAVCAGGGNQDYVVKELIANGIHVLVTGLTVKNGRSEETHRIEEENGINVLGGTHYSTEKFACIAMCEYFRKLGLPSEFVGDTPCFADL